MAGPYAVLVLLVAALLGCGRLPGRPGEAWVSPARRDDPLVGVIWDARAGRALSPEALFERLAAAPFVLLGEKHDNADHHRLQARVLRALAARGRRPAVVLEMWPADVGPALAAVLAGPAPSAEAVREATGWDGSGWPDFALYAPLVEAALAAQLPLAAGDLARASLAALRGGGLAALGPEERAALAVPALAPEQEAALREELQSAHCGLAPEALLSRLVEVQRARDAQLARALWEAARSPGADGALLVAGAEHVRRDRAVPVWLARSAPGAPAASLALLEVSGAAPDAAGELAARYGAEPPFDYAWFTPRVDELDPCERYREELERLGGRGPG